MYSGVTPITFKVLLGTLICNVCKFSIMNNNCESELGDIREKLDDIYREVRSFTEDTNRQHLESILAFVRSDYSDAMEKHLVADDTIKYRMPKPAASIFHE